MGEIRKSTADYIRDLARQHNVTCQGNVGDRWAAKMSELADKEVVLDEIALFILALERDGVLAEGNATKHLLAHLAETTPGSGEKGVSNGISARLARASRPQAIVASGQTGVERAALDFAEKALMDTQGFNPKGEVIHGGSVPARYRNPLSEENGTGPADWVKKNILLADAVVVFNTISADTRETICIGHTAHENKIPFLILRDRPDPRRHMLELLYLLTRHRPRALAVLGTAGCHTPAMYCHAMEVLSLAILPLPTKRWAGTGETGLG